MKSIWLMGLAAAVLCMLVAALPPCAAAASAGSDAASKRALAAPASTPRSAETVGGGVWALDGGALSYAAPRPAAPSSIDLEQRGYGSGVQLAVDPYDDSVWVTTRAGLLLHFATTGALVGGSALGGVADALFVALDQSPWVLVGETLIHVSRAGTLLERSPVPMHDSTPPLGLAVDALRNQIWVHDANGVWRLDRRVADPHWARVTGVDAPRAMTLDILSGNAWVLAGRSLAALDDRGDARRAVGLPDESIDTAAIEFDAASATVMLRAETRVDVFDRDGNAVATLFDHAGTAMPAPLRIEPRIALVRPPSGGSTVERTPTAVLQLGATCNASRCELPDGYFESMKLVANYDGLAASTGRVDVAARQFEVTPGASLAPGRHVLAVHATDAFGHSAQLEGTLGVLDRLDAPAGASGGAASADHTAPTNGPKAANKPPVVSLTSPVSGATFRTGAAIPLAASASDIDGTLTKVEFYRDGSTLLGAVVAPPYQYAWSDAKPGTYSLTAKAYDNRNRATVSASVTITVIANLPPAVALKLPADASGFAEGASIPLEATATDSDGRVVRVEFFDGDALIRAVTARRTSPRGMVRRRVRIRSPPVRRTMAAASRRRRPSPSTSCRRPSSS